MKAFVFLDVAKENLPLSFTRHALLQPNGIIKIFPSTLILVFQLIDLILMTISCLVFIRFRVAA